MRHKPAKNEHDVYAHFRTRLLERFNIFICIDGWRELNRSVRSGMYSCVSIQSRTRKWYRIEIDGNTMWCCWQNRFGLCTALTEEQFNTSFRSANGDLLSR